MENRKGSGIFLGVIGVATLIVAIIGATFAFFGANAASAENAIGATGAVLALGYSDNTSGLKHNLIPARNEVAHYAATNTDHITSKGACIDDNKNEICGIYEFTIGNPSLTTAQGLFGNIKIATMEFQNLWFEILDEKGDVKVGPLSFADSVRNVDGVIDLTELNQTLLPTPSAIAEGNEEDPSKYPKLCTYGQEYDNDGEEDTPMIECTQTNVRSYKMIVWIKEAFEDQTEADSGKMFAAGINFTSANDKTGVTGVIHAAPRLEIPEGFENYDQ